jgi:hypothetical protein
MKRFFSTFLFAFVALIAMLVPSVARGDTRSSFLYDPTTKLAAPAVTTDVGRLTSLFGKKGFDLDAVGFASATTNGIPAVGYGVLGKYQIAKELGLRFGPALILRQNEKPIGAFLLSFELKF